VEPSWTVDSFSDTRSNDKAEYLDMWKVDEQQNNDDFDLGNTWTSDTASEPMHSDCTSQSSFNGSDSDSNAKLEDLKHSAGEYEQRDTHKDSYQELSIFGQQNTPNRADVLAKSTGSVDCLRSTEPADCEWELIKITSKKHSNGTNFYKVRWKETWEPENAVYNARKLVDTYKKRRRAQSVRQNERRKRQIGKRRLRTLAESKAKKCPGFFHSVI